MFRPLTHSVGGPSPAVPVFPQFNMIPPPLPKLNAPTRSKKGKSENEEGDGEGPNSSASDNVFSSASFDFETATGDTQQANLSDDEQDNVEQKPAPSSAANSKAEEKPQAKSSGWDDFDDINDDNGPAQDFNL